MARIEETQNKVEALMEEHDIEWCDKPARLKRSGSWHASLVHQPSQENIFAVGLDEHACWLDVLDKIREFIKGRKKR